MSAFSLNGSTALVIAVLGSLSLFAVPTLASAADSSVTISFDNLGAEAGVTPLGTEKIKFLGSRWSGGVVAAGATEALHATLPGAYFVSDSGATVRFTVPVTQVRFFFVHSSGEPQGGASAIDANDNVLLDRRYTPR